MVRVRFFGINFTITFGFAFVMSMLSVMHSPSLGFMAVASCFIHEAGHCLAAIILNVKIKGVKFWAGGILIEKETRLSAFLPEMLILICGPLANILFGLLYQFSGCREAAILNFTIAAFNLLPFRTLDGGSILERSTEAIFGTTLLRKSITVPLGLLIIVLLAYNNAGIAAVSAIILLTVNEILC